MNNYSKLYWLTRLDYLSGFIEGIGILLLVLALVAILYAFVFSDKSFTNSDQEDNEIDLRRKLAAKRAKWLVPTGVFIILISLFIPSKNEAILIMAGGKTLDFIGQDSSLNKLPAQTTAVISKYLDNALKEMKDKN